MYYIINPKINYISAQYHVVFDNDFQITAANKDAEIEVWKGLYKLIPKLRIVNLLDDKYQFSFKSP